MQRIQHNFGGLRKVTILSDEPLRRRISLMDIIRYKVTSMAIWQEQIGMDEGVRHEKRKEEKREERGIR